MKNTEDLRMEFIQEHEKRYNRAHIKFIILYTLWIIAFFLITSLLAMNGRNVVLPMIIYIIVCSFIVTRTNMEYANNVNVLTKKWTDDFDTDFALDVYREILQRKKKKDYACVLVGYLNLLIITCQFDAFEKEYIANEKIIRKSWVRILPFFKETFAGISIDKSLYLDLLYQHKFTKYHKMEGNLSQRKANLRMSDERYEINQLYERHEYRKVIDKIDKSHTTSKYEEIVYETLKQRCFYHLQEDYEMPVFDSPEFLCVRRLKYLVETGEEYSYDRAEALVTRIDKDTKIGKKSRKKRFIISYALLFIALLSLFIDTNVKRDEDISGEFVFHLEVWDVEVLRTYGVCKNDDISAGIIYGKISEDDIMSTYYLAGINYFQDEMVPKMALNYDVIGFKMDESKIYTFKGDESTYVAFVAEKGTQIYYNDELICVESEQLRLVDGEEQSVVMFIVDGNFDESKLEIKVTK